MLFPPTLPQHDKLARKRAHELEQAREEYVYDRSYEDILYCKEVPTRDKSDLKYWVGLGKMILQVKLNETLTDTGKMRAEELHTELESKLTKHAGAGWHRLHAVLDELVPAADDAFEVSSFADYDRAYRTLREPLAKGRWEADDFFAWQAIAGCNPTVIERMRAVPDKFPITNAHFQAALGDHDTLDAAIAEGRIYIADYWCLDGLTGGMTDDHQKYVWAPIAAYCWQPARGERPSRFAAVAIQCGQRPGPDTPILTPADGTAWLMARTTVAVADSQDQGLGRHFGCCHLVMQAVAMASKRQLAARHPLRVLLDPHVENTLIANDICRTSLTNPNGIVDRLQAMELPVSLRFCNDAIARFRLLESDPVRDCAARGVDDVEALPVYPHRDDQLLVWEAVFAWVDAYVRAYYGADQDVLDDHELEAFVGELMADGKGRLRGLIVPKSVRELVDLIARVVFRGSAYHASINYSLYDYTYAPNGPTSGFGPGPTGTPADTASARLAMHPPYDIANEVISIYYNLQLRLNELGKYGASLEDPRVRQPLDTFNRTLAQIEDIIRQRNEQRLVPYVFSMPSNITASIHV